MTDSREADRGAVPVGQYVRPELHQFSEMSDVTSTAFLHLF